MIFLVLCAFFLMLFESLFARACHVTVTTHPSTKLHVAVHDLYLGVFLSFVLSKPGLGLESLVADLTLVLKQSLLFLLHLLLHSMLFWVHISNVSSPIPRVIEWMVAVIAREVAFGVGQILRMRIEQDETIWRMLLSL